MLASEVVHTTGLNWESLGVIIAAFTFIFTAFTWFIVRRDSQNDRQKNETAQAVKNLETVLLEKLETKENVNQIRVTLATLQADVKSVKEDLHADQAFYRASKQ